MDSVPPLHPNDQVVFKQYPDATTRYTYPPLPHKGGNPNAVASDSIVASVLAKFPNSSISLSAPVVPASQEPALPDDPDVKWMRDAGWL